MQSVQKVQCAECTKGAVCVWIVHTCRDRKECRNQMKINGEDRRHQPSPSPTKVVTNGNGFVKGTS